MKKIIVVLIITASVATAQADGITIKQVREAGRKARIETNEALKKGERKTKFKKPIYYHLLNATRKTKKCKIKD